jgi:hypothetical protein
VSSSDRIRPPSGGARSSAVRPRATLPPRRRAGCACARSCAATLSLRSRQSANLHCHVHHAACPESEVRKGMQLLLERGGAARAGAALCLAGAACAASAHRRRARVTSSAHGSCALNQLLPSGWHGLRTPEPCSRIPKGSAQSQLVCCKPRCRTLQHPNPCVANAFTRESLAIACSEDTVGDGHDAARLHTGARENTRLRATIRVRTASPRFSLECFALGCE